MARLQVFCYLVGEQEAVVDVNETMVAACEGRFTERKLEARNDVLVSVAAVGGGGEEKVWRCDCKDPPRPPPLR